MSSIFVSIASYKDSEVFNTVADIYKRATHPERVFLGVFLQDTNLVFEKFTLNFNNKNIKIKHVQPEHAEGCGWARNIIMKELYGNEDYFLLVDSHSRFKIGWDVEYINMLNKTPTESVISGFPREYHFNESYEVYSERDLSSIYIPNEIPYIGNFSGPHEQKLAVKENEKIMNISGGNTFGKGYIVNALTVDDYKYYGECEQELYSLLLYQCGLDIYAPCKNLIWHKYFVLGVDNYREIFRQKKNKINFWPDAVDLNCNKRSADEWLRDYNYFINSNIK